MKILLFEDKKYKDLFPLTMLRAVYDIKAGALSLKQRAELILSNEIILHCRKHLENLLREENPNKVNNFNNDDLLMLNGRAYFDAQLLNQILKDLPSDHYYSSPYSEIIAANISKNRSSAVKDFLKQEENLPDKKFFDSIDIKEKKFDSSTISLMQYPWDPIKIFLSGGLENDLKIMIKSGNRKSYNSSRKEFINHDRIYIDSKVEILPSVIIDAKEGDVLIEEGTRIEPFCYIKGPVHIGKNCLVKSGAKIYGPCSIGDSSKIAGEITGSVFHSYVNKQHDGFIGDSYICPFVNLGADTVTSNLKNNYSKIKMNIEGNNIDTDMQFLGSIIGDHSKTAINTMLNTGSLIGIFTNVFGAGFLPQNIRSFSWVKSGKDSIKYNLGKAIDTAKIVMRRRNIEMSGEYEKLIRMYYEN